MNENNNPTIERLKQRAKKIKNDLNITHTEALKIVSNDYGFQSWEECSQVFQKTRQIKDSRFELYYDSAINTDIETHNSKKHKNLILNTNSVVSKNKKILINFGIEFSTFEPTITGFNKSILDATQPVRTHFEIERFHFYKEQKQGPEFKVIKNAYLLLDEKTINSKLSLYRPITKKGDPRMWLTRLKEIASPNDIIAITVYKDSAYIFNISQTDLSASIENPQSNIGQYLNSFKKDNRNIANELLSKLKELSKSPLKSLRDGDTGVGYTIETHLNIAANSSKEPDYKGIEIKSGRGAKNRTTLFAQVADWSISPCKGSAEILNKYGYERENDFRLYCTVSTKKENSQGLKFIYDQEKSELQEWYKNEDLVAIWPDSLLRDRLEEKHNETFWIEVESKLIEGKEYFQLLHITHTKAPVLSQLVPLLQEGFITMDHLIKKNSSGRVSEKGPLFKINKVDLELLFPKPEKYNLK